MGDLTDVEKELERERERLDHMISETRTSSQPNSDAILEQSRKVDSLLAKVQKACLLQRGKNEKPRNDLENR